MEAQRINPSNLLAIYDNAVILYNNEKFADAAHMLQRVIDANPPDDLLSKALDLAVYANVNLGRLELAVQLANRAVEIQPNSSRSWDILSGVYSIEKQWAKSLEAALRAIQLNPDEPNPYFNLGRAYLHTKQIQDAQHSYQKGVNNAKASHQVQIISDAVAELTQDMTDYPELKADIEPIIAFLKSNMNAD